MSTAARRGAGLLLCVFVLAQMLPLQWVQQVWVAGQLQRGAPCRRITGMSALPVCCSGRPWLPPPMQRAQRVCWQQLRAVGFSAVHLVAGTPAVMPWQPGDLLRILCFIPASAAGWMQGAASTTAQCRWGPATFAVDWWAGAAACASGQALQQAGCNRAANFCAMRQLITGHVCTGN